MKCCCENCKYGGFFSPTEHLASCDCKNKYGRIKGYDSLFKIDRYYVERNSWDEEKDCDNFLPEVESEIEYETKINIQTTCPFCKTNNTIYDEDLEGEATICCEECGKDYHTSWCEY